MAKAETTVWRLEWPDGSGAYRGQAAEKLLPPCYQVLNDTWNTIDFQPSPNNDEKLWAAIRHLGGSPAGWHFGFASRAAFDRWFDPANLAFVNSPECAAGMLRVACYVVPNQWVICGEHQALFHPNHAKPLSACPCNPDPSLLAP